MNVNPEDYKKYIELQKGKSLRTRYLTIRHGGRREWIYNKMQEMGVEGESILCVGARDFTEVDFFEKKGFKAEGIDLHGEDKIIECDMSKMLEHPYIKDQKYDIVYCNDVLEHCLDLDGFIEGLNKVCNKYFVCMNTSGKAETEERYNIDWWDCSIHKVMIGIEDEEVYRKNILEAFSEFEIVINESHKDNQRIFLILKKK